MITFIAIGAFIGAVICAQGGNGSGVATFIAAQFLLHGMAHLQETIREARK